MPDSTKNVADELLRAVPAAVGDADNAQANLAQRHREALAVCSRVLLSADDLDEVDEALQGLLAATDATSIFIELNVEHPELGLCSRILREITEPGFTADTDTWTLVPWAEMPDSYEQLSRGKPFGFLISELGPVERALYRNDPALSELDVPFFVNGRWVGLIGLSDIRMERVWRPDEVGLMITAAEMVGAFWERRESRQAAQLMVTATEQALRQQQALFASSRALLSIPDEKEALEVVLRALTEAADVDYGFVERNVEVDSVGLCSRTVVEIDRTDPDGGVDPYWELVPWSEMPDSYNRLSNGLPFDFGIEDLGPVERHLYESDPHPVRSEIDIPIFVDGSWEGLVGLADVVERRQWTPEAVKLLATVADLIGAHWGRRRTQEQLAELLTAKDAFLASVSHELRTPLTVVVGLAAEIRDDPDRFSTESVRDLIGIIAQQSSDLADIVDDLLVAARIDDEIHVFPGRIDLGIEAASVVDSLGMGTVVTAGNAVAWADAKRVRQIVRNLLTNAQRYGGSEVRIEIKAVHDRAIVRVIDNGDGVDEGVTGSLFEPYQIGHREHSQPDAIGLGLSISSRLARLMGGDLRYAREGDLSVFSLAVPRHAAH